MNTPFKIGTDCSGIEAPLEAFRQLINDGELPFTNIEHSFSSEIDKWCVKSIKANYSPKIIYDDMTVRDNTKTPYVDLYVCGFPCQPFSIAGKRLGLKDMRGNVIQSCIDYIQTQYPKYFILENVKGLLTHEKGETWKIIQEMLKSLNSYTTSFSILNTKDFGIPQNRERLFIVGVRKDIKENYIFPLPFTGDKLIKDYIDVSDTHNDPIRKDVILCGMLDKIPRDSVFVDFSFKKYHYPKSNEFCPCITADSRTWCVPMRRYANINERFSLQGFQNKYWKQVVSDTQMKRQIGNSMSVNVLKELIKMFFI